MDYDDDEAQHDHTPQTIGVNQAAPIVVQVIEGEDHVLTYTQKKRQQIVTAMMGEDGEKLNSLEKGDKMVVLAALDGMDRAALGRKRLKTDEKIGASQAQAAALIAQVLQTPGAMQAGMVIDGQIQERRAVPQLPVGLPEPEVVPGEMDSDAAQMDFDTFMAQSLTPGQ
jgi:hypothetical protein